MTHGTSGVKKETGLGELLGQELIGKVNSLSVTLQEAKLQLTTREGETIFVTLYRDSAHPEVLSPRDGMYRGTLLALAQRALTEGHRVSVDLNDSSTVAAITLFGGS